MRVLSPDPDCRDNIGDIAHFYTVLGSESGSTLFGVCVLADINTIYFLCVELLDWEGIIFIFYL